MPDKQPDARRLSHREDPRRPFLKGAPAKVCIFVPNWIGDAVMATPALRALRKFLGNDVTLIGIMKPYVFDVLRGTSWLDDIWFYDREASEPKLRPATLIKRIRRSRIGLSVHLTNDFLSVLIARLGGVKERAGYVRYKRGPLLTIKLYPPMIDGKPTPISTLDYYLELVYALGCPEEPPKMELAATEDDERAADRVWETLGLRPDKRIVALNSSGAYGPAKLWPDESFAELARRIVTREDHDVLILCGPRERERALRIARMAAAPRVFTLADEDASIGLSKACLARSRLLVTTDSGPRHVAAAFDVPVITLFGPTHVAWSDTHFAKEVRLRIPVDCGPCQKRECPLEHHKCLRGLDVDTVFAAVCAQLHGVRNPV